MKLSEMKKNDKNTFYFIHYYDEDTKMWCPYVTDRGYSYFSDEYLIYHLTEVKKRYKQYKVYKQTTMRVE